MTFADGYFIDRAEVTAEAFAAFLTERADNSCSYAGDSADCVGGGSPAGTVDWDGTSAQTRSTCQASSGGAADESCASHPAVEVTWYGAGAFCQWAGGRLCSEAEWERAAKGTSHRTYPWGETSPGSTLADCDEWGCGDGFDATAPIGSFPDGMSPVGALDLSGNVWEWVEDDDHASYDGTGRPDDGTAWLDDPRDSNRVARGGAWDNGDVSLHRTSFRHADRPAVAYDYFGLRCCRSPAP